MTKPLNWFEIPTSNIDKARDFYEAVFGVKMTTGQIGSATYSAFPYDRDNATGGALIQDPACQPGIGPLLYLNAGDTLDLMIQRALEGGATLATPRTALPPGMGFFAHILDLDGNKIGLHGAQ
jgi:predicted enzyme related to lactoylglutathione lyase